MAVRVIPLNHVKTARSLVLFCGIENNVERAYFDLGRNLSVRRCSLVVLSEGLGFSIGDIALRVLGECPGLFGETCDVGGYSFGGIVALEVCRLLHQQSKFVGRYVNIDTDLTLGVQAIPDRYSSVSRDDALRYFVHREFWSHCRSRGLTLEKSEFLSLPSDIQVATAAAALTHSHSRRADIERQLAGLLRRLNVNTRAAFDYDMRPYAGPTSIIASSEYGLSLSDKVDGLFDNVVSFETLPASHSKLVSAANVPLLSAAIVRALRD